MKKIMNRIIIMIFIGVFGLSVAGCGDKEAKEVEATNDYTVEEVKQKLAEILEIDESEITVSNEDKGAILSYGDWEVFSDTYVLNDPSDALELFEIQTLIGDFDDKDSKRIDKKDHKIWIEESADNPGLYSFVAMKNNLVLSISSYVEPDVIIDAFDLD